MGKWTPGPWEVRNKNGVHPVARPFVAVAVAERHDKNSEANACLIAEAPAMAETLKAMLAVWDKIYSRLPVSDEAEDAEFGPMNEARAILGRINGDAP